MRIPKSNAARKGPTKKSELSISQSSSLFAKLRPEHRKWFEEHLTVEVYNPGQKLIPAGTIPRGAFCIAKGTARIQMVGESGRIHLLKVAQPGELAGLPFIFANLAPQVEVVAHDQVTAGLIPRPLILKLAAESPEFIADTLEALSKDNIQHMNRVLMRMEKASEQRVADALLVFFDHKNSIKWTRRDLASWAGTTIETCIRALAEFEKQGWITRARGHIVILNRKAMLELSRL